MLPVTYRSSALIRGACRATLRAMGTTDHQTGPVRLSRAGGPAQVPPGRARRSCQKCTILHNSAQPTRCVTNEPNLGSFRKIRPAYRWAMPGVLAQKCTILHNPAQPSPLQHERTQFGFVSQNPAGVPLGHARRSCTKCTKMHNSAQPSHCGTNEPNLASFRKISHTTREATVTQ